MKEDNKDFAPAFNGSIHTLERINTVLVDLSSCTVNGDVLGMYRNVKELYKETFPVLNSGERKTGKKKYDDLRKYKISYDEDTDILSFDDGLLDFIEDFDLWLRTKLHRHKITMVDRKKFQAGMQALMNRYGIDNNG